MRNDLISRCKLFNRLATLPAPAEANTFKAEVYKIIQEMETEDRPQGEWEIVGKNHPYKRCPFCKRVRAFTDTRFCDWCGADMREGE